MGFLSQVPLSARFLLYRAVRRKASRAAGIRGHNRTRDSSRPQQGKQGRQRKNPLPPVFYICAHDCEGIFSSHPRANLYKKGSPGVQKKKCCGRPHRAPTTVNGQSIFVKRYNGSSFPTIQRASRAFCQLCLFLFQIPAFSFRQG